MLRRLDNLAGAAARIKAPVRLQHSILHPRWIAVGTAGLAGTTPLSHFAPWDYLSPSARLGAESIRVQRVPEDLIRCFFEMGQIHGVRIFGSRRPKRTAGPSLQAPASGAGAIWRAIDLQTWNPWRWAPATCPFGRPGRVRQPRRTCHDSWHPSQLLSYSNKE